MVHDVVVVVCITTPLRVPTHAHHLREVVVERISTLWWWISTLVGSPPEGYPPSIHVHPPPEGVWMWSLLWVYIYLHIHLLEVVVDLWRCSPELRRVYSQSPPPRGIRGGDVHRMYTTSTPSQRAYPLYSP